MSRRRRDADPLELAWTTLEEGDAAMALQIARSVPAGDTTDRVGRWILEAMAQLELGELEEARRALAQAGDPEDPDGDPDVTWTAAEIALRGWELERARALFELCAARDPTPAVYGRLALLDELDGEFDAAERRFAEAERLDPEGWPRPERIGADAFDAAVEEASRELPPAFRDALEEVAILVEPMPDRRLGRVDPLETPPDLLGLFVGSSHLERDVTEGLELPPTIHLYQRNLERVAADRDELVQEIRVTLFHEFAHLLGFDEEGVAELGLE